MIWLNKLLRPRAGTRAAYRFHLRYWFSPDPAVAASVLATLRPSRALAPELSEGPAVDRLTVFAPHPDDEVMGPGGAIIKAQARGARIDVIYLTDGEACGTDAAARRREEAQGVADQLGFHAVFLGLPAKVLAATEVAIAATAEALRATQPQAVMLPFLLDDNDDHRVVGALVAAAAGPAELDPAMEVWAYQVYSALPANVLVPLGDAAAAKAEAIRLYRSQAAVRDWAHYSLGLNAYNTRLTPRRCQDPYVEAFFVVPLEEYARLCKQVAGDQQ